MGQSGGLWLLWISEVGNVSVIDSTDQFIHVRVEDGAEILHLVAVYAAPTVSRRSGLWNSIQNTVQNIDGPLVIGGDFNTIVRIDERTGGNGCLSTDSIAFGNGLVNWLLLTWVFAGTSILGNADVWRAPLSRKCWIEFCVVLILD